MSVATAVNPFLSRAGSGEYELCPAGNTPAMLIAMIDLGTFNEEFKDEKTGEKVYKDVRKIGMFWELTATRQINGRPFIMGERYNYSTNMSNKSGFRKMLEAWRGAGYGADEAIDPMALVDVPCLVNVVHNRSGDKTYANIKGVSASIAGMPTPPRTRPFIAHHLSQGEPPDLSHLPYIYGQKVTDIIGQSRERSGKLATSPATETTTPAARSSVARDQVVGQVEGLLAKAAMLGSPDGGKLYEQAIALMRDHVIGDTELSAEAQKQLDTPF